MHPGPRQDQTRGALGSVPGIVPNLVGDLAGLHVPQPLRPCPRGRAGAMMPTRRRPGRRACLLPASMDARGGRRPGRLARTQRTHDRARDRNDGPVLETLRSPASFRSARGFMKGKKPLRAVNGVSLKIPKGQVVGLVGESGCGKSTLANMIAGPAASDRRRCAAITGKSDRGLVLAARHRPAHPADLPGPLFLAEPDQDHPLDHLAAACAFTMSERSR